MLYHALKSVHITAVILSGTLFFIRGIWMLRTPQRLRERWVRIVPHVIDTVLLASAIALTFNIHQYPLTHDWLTAKVAGLLVYIVLGMVALRYGPDRRSRTAAWLGALAVFLYIVSVALTHDPLPFRAGAGGG